MQNHAFSPRLVAAALIAALGLASPAFASKHDNHAEGSDDKGKSSHVESHGSSANDSGNHPENHGGGSDDHGGSFNPAGAQPFRAVLAGTVEPLARGEAKLKTKRRGDRFEAEVKIPVPSAALAIPDKAAALDATLTLSLSRAGVAYAECDLDPKSFKRKGSRRLAEYKVEVADRGGLIQAHQGICDVDLATPGMQSGVPATQTGDAAAVRIDTNGVDFLDGVF